MANAALYAHNRMCVKDILRRPNWKARDRHIGVFNYFLQREVEAGTYFLVTEPDHDLYIVLGLTKTTIQLPAHGRGGLPFLAYLLSRYGLSEREEATKFLYDTLRLYIWENGERVELRRFSAFNQETKAAYISTYDGELWKLDGETPTRYGNGEDGVFFADDDGGIPCAPDIAPHGELFQALTDLNYSPISPGGMTPVHQQRALIVWILSLAFPDLMPTKPLLIVEGAQGSGKSSSMQQTQLVLFGRKRPIVLSKNKEDDFGIILLRNPLCVFDNLDSFVEWLPDAVCAYATSAEWTRRKLYTDNEQVTIKPHAFIAVASKNPASFRREDTADRCIVLRLERRKKFIRQQRIEQRVLRQRPKLLGEYLWYVNQMVKVMAQLPADEDVEEDNRMADFAGMARIVGQVMEWSEEDVEDLLAALQKERNAFINEADPLVDILAKWIVYSPAGGRNSVGREIALNTLFSELEAIAQVHSLPFYKSATMLAQKLRSPHLETDFIIRSLYVDNHQTYKIWRRTDPQLAAV